MHVIERTERFTLIGADARRGKLTLFEAEGPRDRGALGRIGLRVSSLAGREPCSSTSARASRSCSSRARRTSNSTSTTSGSSPPDPAGAAAGWEAFGFERVGETTVEVGGAFLELLPGNPGTAERPLLNHVAVLVDSVEEHVAGAEERGIEIDDVVDAPNTLAVFVWGPDRVKLEYVEHKPSFSLS